MAASQTFLRIHVAAPLQNKHKGLRDLVDPPEILVNGFPAPGVLSSQ